VKPMSTKTVGRTAVGLTTLSLTVGTGISTVAAADPAPVYTGTITEAFLDAQPDQTLAVIGKLPTDPRALKDADPIGWYMTKGLQSARLVWAARTDAPMGASGSCQPSVRLNGSEAYSGPPLGGSGSGVGSWLLMPLYLPDGGTLIQGPPLTDVTAKVGTGTADLALDCGALGTASWSMPTVVLPAAPEDREPGVSIDDGADFTNNAKVKLHLGWDGLLDRVKVSNDGGFAPSKTKEIKIRQEGPLDWTVVELAAERIPRTVYVKFHYVAYGWQKQTYTDDIILDTVEPQIVSATTTQSGAATLAAAQRTLRVKAKDNKSGIVSMQVSTGKPRKKAKVVTYRKAVKVNGTGRVFVRVRDGAGNWSKWRTAG
jgi:hypothetical protein